MTSINSQPSNFAPELEPISPLDWFRKNLFNTWYNSLLTVIIISGLGWMLFGFLSWATKTAKWDVIPSNLPLFFVGRFPADQYWRLWVILALISILSGLTWGFLTKFSRSLFNQNVLITLIAISLVIVLFPTPLPFRLLLLGVLIVLVASAWVGKQVSQKMPLLGRWLPFSWFLSFIIITWLIGGGLGLKPVSTNLWGGLMLTLIMSFTSILLSFPFGILLALGRQSTLPVIRLLSVIYIEFIRGLPLITILFMGQVLLPLFLPDGVRPDRVLRAIIGLTLFSAAYLAENVRGGLQAIPRGQYEAAKALGLNPALTTGLIVLPQALKVAIPSIVGQFISLFQDTTLLAIVGLVELLGISRSILANPKFLGRYAEVYIFIGILYWLFCYAMSRASRKLEQQLNTEHK